MSRDLYPASLAARIKPGKPFRPSNSSDGMAFEARWCEHCRHNEPPDADPCDIVARAMLFDIGEPDYPAEWTHDGRGQPCCKAFVEMTGEDGAPARVVPAPGQMGLVGFEGE